MKSIVTCLGVCGVCGLTFLAGRASTVVQPDAGAPALTTVGLAQPDTNSPQPEIPAEMQAMLDANKPGPQHELLARMNGSWRAEMVGTSPDGSEIRTEGSMHASEIFEGKFIGQEFSGEFMGIPFEGLGVYGYSTMAEQFQSVWFDSMGTHLYYATGEASTDGKTITFHGQEPNPEGGDMVDYRDEIEFTSDTTHVFRRFYKHGADYSLGFQVTYTRE